MSSANSEFKYDHEYTFQTKCDYAYSVKKVTLRELVNECHKELSTKLNWNYVPLVEGSFGFDNMVVSIGYALNRYFNNMKLQNSIAPPDEEEIAEYIHKGWAINYIYWRDNSPWENNNVYRKPYKLLNDENRNKLADTSYKNLNQQEKDKDLIIAKILMKYLEK